MKKEAQRIWLRGLQRVSCFAVLCAFVGCGGGGAVDPDAGMSDDEKAIVNMVSSLSDISGNLERLRESFTSANAPTSSDQTKIRDLKFRVPDVVTVSGTTATFDVEISSYAEGSTQSTKTWKAVKEGDKWKLSETPM